MKIIFKAEVYQEPTNLDAPLTDLDIWPRITGLAWIVINDDGRIVRGFQFKVKHTVGVTSFPPEIEAEAEALGYPAKYVIDRFLSDCDSVDTLITHGLKRNFGILAAEAIRYGSRAKSKIANRICTKDGIDELYEGEERTLSALYHSLFGDFIDDELPVMSELQVLVNISEELIYRGILKPNAETVA